MHALHACAMTDTTALQQQQQLQQADAKKKKSKALPELVSVVVDELHMMGDDRRGLFIERFLTILRYTAIKLQVSALDIL
jgi:replicative superfamily II helicase